MKKITLIISTVIVSALFVKAQGPYSLPFQETFSTLTLGVEYTEETLNAALATKGWGYPVPKGVSGPTTVRIHTKTISEGGYILTPEINVPSGTALELNFVMRPFLNDVGADAATKKLNNLERNMYVVIGTDTVYDHQKLSYDMANPLMQNLNRFMGTFIYDGPSPIRVKIFSSNTYEGVWASEDPLRLNNDGLTLGNNTGAGNNTGTLIRATDTVPALNIAYGHNMNLGTIDLNINAAASTVNKSFTLKGVNHVGDIEFSDSEASTISLPVKTYVPVAGSVNESVAVDITVPASVGTYTEKVTVVADGDRAAGLTNTLKRPTRTIWFTYNVVDTSTGLNTVSKPVSVYASKGAIHVNSAEAVNVEVFSMSGALINVRLNVASAIIEMPKGLYLVKTGTQITKVVL